MLSIKAIYIIAFFIFSVIFSVKSVSAYTMTRTATDYCYHASEHGGHKFRLYIDNKEAYCLEPDKGSSNNAPYDYIGGLGNFNSNDTINKKLDFFYGRAKQFSEQEFSDKYYVYMQLALWYILGYEVKDVGTQCVFTSNYGGSNDDLTSEFWSWYNEIERDYNYFINNPTWDNNTIELEVGKPIELNANELIYAYRYSDIENLDVTLSNNKITLTAKQGFRGGKLRILKNPYKYYKSNVRQDITWIYSPNNNDTLQKVAQFNFDIDPKFITLNLTAPNSIRIKKVGSSGEPVANVVFETSYSEDFSTDIWTYTTDETGYTEKVANWANRRVYIREKSVPYPYIKSDEVKYIDVVYGQDFEVTFTNEKLTRVRIKKVGSSGESIANVVFEVSEDENFSNVEEYTTNEQGYSEYIEKVENTKLYIREKSVPHPYIKSNEVKEIILRKDVDNEVTFTNYKQIGQIRVQKKGQFLDRYEPKKINIEDEEYTVYKPIFISKALKGVTFGLYSEDNRLLDTQITDEKGIAIFNNLELGKYKIKELATIKGYILNKQVRNVELIYKENLIATSNVIINDTVEENNKLINVSVKINKEFENTKEFKRNKKAVIGLYNKNDIGNLKANSLLEVFLFDENTKTKIFNNLLPNEYYVKEISTENHYILDTKEYKLDFTKTDKTILSVDITNNLKRGSIRLHKIDSTNKKALEGVKFGLYTEDEKLISEHITNEEGEIIIENLEYGKYYFKELETIQGYIIDDSKKYFEIKENEEILSYTKENEKKPYEIIIKKLDSSTKKALEGVKAVIYDEQGNKLYEVISDSEGVFKIGSEPLKLTFGKYYIKELETIKGYVLDETEHSFEVLKNGELDKEIILYNDEELVQTGVASSTKKYLILLLSSFLILAYLRKFQINMK